ncbi:MAG: hypothetical protein LBJ91_01020 [Clostridiales Family XIII bacterium]|jgi:hypothetical protein|nr:hypothetical protein [Clostridiales Family XIII bacterium]
MELKVLRNNNNGARRSALVIPVACAVLLSCTAFTSFAETGAGVAVDSASKVTLSATQTDFTLPLSIDHADAFAGVELAVQCGDGVTIESVDYSSKNMSYAGPAEARGLVWFATFSGSNELAGRLTATIHATYEGKANTSLVIDHAAFYTIDGSSFRTENMPLRKTVEITKEGAAHTPPPLEPPNTGNPPGAGNPPSGAEVNGGASGNGNDAEESGDSPTGTTTDRNTQPGRATEVSDSAPTAIPAVITNALADSAGSADNPGSASIIQNEQITSGDTEDTQQTSISSSIVPRAGGNTNTMTPSGDAAAMSTAAMIMALACLAAFAFSGFLFIKRRKDEKNRMKKRDEIKEAM